ncbi:MAG: DNA translocase FtsK 4TM domain-containing protein, partial [Atopobiaceae bacterium]|nr:DNA translocase FtsK 4TM domain-containing protein [Atopobiaceae bacterium]
MPSKRNANAAQKAKGKAKAKPRSGMIMAENTKNDILGILGIVVAIALALSLFSTSQAIVTVAVRTALVKGFGAGALLVPIAILLFSLTFFVDSDVPVSARAAIGLTLIVLSVLAILSIGTPSAELLPDSVLQEPALSTTGGYVGGGIAWVLLKLVGRGVRYVILGGVIVAGIVICG